MKFARIVLALITMTAVASKPKCPSVDCFGGPCCPYNDPNGCGILDAHDGRVLYDAAMKGMR